MISKHTAKDTVAVAEKAAIQATTAMAEAIRHPQSPLMRRQRYNNKAASYPTNVAHYFAAAASTRSSEFATRLATAAVLEHSHFYRWLLRNSSLLAALEFPEGGWLELPVDALLRGLAATSLSMWRVAIGTKHSSNSLGGKLVAAAAATALPAVVGKAKLTTCMGAIDRRDCHTAMCCAYLHTDTQCMLPYWHCQPQTGYDTTVAMSLPSSKSIFAQGGTVLMSAVGVSRSSRCQFADVAVVVLHALQMG